MQDRLPEKGLTLEASLYLLLVITGGVLRFWGLGDRPLSREEAEAAYQAWLFYQGQGTDPGPVPVLLPALLLGYSLLGASDFVVRLAPAIVGTGLIASAYLLRGILGRYGGLALAFLLAFSPTFAFYSRYLGSEIVGSGGGLLLVGGMLAYWKQPRPKPLYMAAIGLALTILAGGTGLAVLLALVLFPILYFLARAIRAGQIPWKEIRGAVAHFIPQREAAGQALILFFSIPLLLPTSGLLIPEGLGKAIEALIVNPSPTEDPISLLVHYEPLLLAFGLLGIITLVPLDPRANLLALWLGVGVILGAEIPAVALPLALSAGLFVERAWPEVDERLAWDMGRLTLFALPLLLYTAVQLSRYASSKEERYIFLVALAILGVVGLAGLFGAWKGLGRGMTSGLWLLLLALGPVTASSTLRLISGDLSCSPEFILREATSPDARTFVEDLEAFSNQMTGDRNALALVTKVEDPVLLWYLRDFRNLETVPRAAAGVETRFAAIITGEDETLDQAGYLGQRYRLRVTWPMPSRGFWEQLRWYLYRTPPAPPEASDIIIWHRGEF